MAKKLSGEAALLSWAQGAASSHGLTVKNLAAAWADGLAFAALAHRYFPDKINFNALKAETREDKLENHRLAYKIFEEAGVYPLLDPEDLVDYPADKKSVVTYLSEVYKGLKGLPAVGAGGGASSAGGSDLDAFAAQLIANHKATKSKAAASAQTSAKSTAAARREPQQSSAPPCTACGEQLSGQTAQIGTSEFHLHCFKCQGCGKKLNATQGASLLAVGNLPYCESCGRQAFIKGRAGGAAKKAPATQGRGDMFERRKQQMQAFEATEHPSAPNDQKLKELELAQARKAAEEEARLKRQVQEEEIRKKREEEAAKERIREEERKARELALEEAKRQRERERAQEEAAQRARDAVAQLERTSSRTETFLARSSSRQLVVDSVSDAADDAQIRAQRRRAEAEARRKQMEEEMAQLEQERLRRQAEREARRKAEAEREEREERERNEKRERERNERKMRLQQEQEQMEREAEERRRQRLSAATAVEPILARLPSAGSLSRSSLSSRILNSGLIGKSEVDNHVETEEDPIAKRRREREERRKAEEAAAAEAERQREEERARRRKEREEARKREEEELERQRQERQASRDTTRPVADASSAPTIPSVDSVSRSASREHFSVRSPEATTTEIDSDLEARRIAREKERELRRKQLEEEEQELERRRQQRAAEREARRKQLEAEEAEYERQRQQRAAEREARRKELL